MVASEKRFEGQVCSGLEGEPGQTETVQVGMVIRNSHVAVPVKKTLIRR